MSDEPRTPPASSGDPARDEKMAALRAKAEALKAARAAAATPGGVAATGTGPTGAAPTTAAPAAAAPAAALEVPVSSVNPGGRPGSPPKAPALEAFGTINNSVEIRAEASEEDNLKKLLGGLGAYQNPIRTNVWQIDYRYYAVARRRLEAVGYKIAEKDYLGRRLKDWSPTSRGWTRVQS